MTHRHSLALAAVLLLLGGSASAQTPPVGARPRSAPTERADVAALRAKAVNGDAGAQFQLGVMYATGQGVPQDTAQAVIWFRKAADQGDADAQYNLGAMYTNGTGVPKDFAQAVIWYRKAADQGVALAQFNLGVMYANGTGVPQDFVEAFKWFNLAASRASAAEQKQVAVGRDEIAKRMTQAQIADAQQRARAWLADFEKRGGR